MFLWTFVFFVGTPWVIGCSGSEKEQIDNQTETKTSTESDVANPTTNSHSSETELKDKSDPSEITESYTKETPKGANEATTRQPQEGFFCGEANGEEQGRRIVNGKTVAPAHRYPWQVLVRVLNHQLGTYSSCGGSLITDQDVLTAGHCVTDIDPKTKLPVLVDLNLTKVYFGVDNRDRRMGPQRQPYRVAVASNLNRSVLHKDLALLQFPDVILFNSSIRPVCLPTNTEELYSNRQATVSGWGHTSTTRRSNADHLRETKLTIMNHTECKAVKQYQMPLTDKHLCTKKSDTGFCDGDSGGPLTVKENGSYVQVGVVSFGVAECPDSSRGKGFPLIFARVTTGLNWIKRQIWGVFSPQRSAETHGEAENPSNRSKVANE